MDALAYLGILVAIGWVILWHVLGEQGRSIRSPFDMKSGAKTRVLGDDAHRGASRRRRRRSASAPDA